MAEETTRFMAGETEVTGWLDWEALKEWVRIAPGVWCQADDDPYRHTPQLPADWLY